jgi:hypothetical protein
MKSIEIKPLTKEIYNFIKRYRKFKVYVYENDKCIKKKYLFIKGDEEIDKTNIFELISLTIQQNSFNLFVNKKYVKCKIGEKVFCSKIPCHIKTMKQYSIFYKTFIETSRNNFVFLKYYKMAHKSFNEYLNKYNYEGICSLMPPIKNNV